MGNQSSSEGGGDSFGYRVLGIQEHSPASSIGLVSFFDFITFANGIRLDHRDATFMELIDANEDRPMQLSIFNVKSQTTRDVMLTPSRKWTGKGMLGVTIRFDSSEGAEDHIIHVLNVAESSPAEIAGLVAYDDYLLGTPERIFRDTDDLFDEVMEKIGRQFQCYVYNKSTDKVRIVTIVPHDKWDGEGFLGAEVGSGYLHRLPDECRKTNGTSIGYVTVSSGDVALTDRKKNTSSDLPGSVPHLGESKGTSLEAKEKDSEPSSLATPSDAHSTNTVKPSTAVSSLSTSAPATTHDSTNATSTLSSTSPTMPLSTSPTMPTSTSPTMSTSTSPTLSTVSTSAEVSPETLANNTSNRAPLRPASHSLDEIELSNSPTSQHSLPADEPKSST